MALSAFFRLHPPSSGYCNIQCSPTPGPETPQVALSVLRVFWRGVLTNILNPKMIVFYLALLPQFINVDLGHPGLQIFLLGGIHNLIGTTFLICIGLAAGKASGWLATTGFGKWMDAIAGVFFMGLALRLLVSGKPGN